MFKLSPDERKVMSDKVRAYALSEFGYQNTIDMWDETLTELAENWQNNYNRVVCEEVK